MWCTVFPVQVGHLCGTRCSVQAVSSPGGWGAGVGCSASLACHKRVSSSSLSLDLSLHLWPLANSCEAVTEMNGNCWSWAVPEAIKWGIQRNPDLGYPHLHTRFYHCWWVCCPPGRLRGKTGSTGRTHQWLNVLIPVFALFEEERAEESPEVKACLCWSQIV